MSLAFAWSLFIPVAQAGWLIDDYRSFREGGCDAEEEGISSPVVLRVLRSTPQAEAGLDFIDEDLHRLFGGDGDWFRPKPGKVVRLSEEDQLCVAKIRGWEEKMRQMHCIEEEAQAVLVSDIGLYRWHRQDMGFPELHRYQDGMIPDERPLRSACLVSQAVQERAGGRWVEWSMSEETVRRPTVDRLMQDFRRLYSEDEGVEPSAEYLDRMERWQRQMTPVRRVQWSATQLEGNPGDEPFRRTDQGICWGTGPFMGQDWFCLEAGTF